MKQIITTFMFTILLSMVGTKAWAYDIAESNADGVTIYYNYINDGKELAVTYKTYDFNSYSGSVVIPEEVTYMNRTRKVASIGSQAFCGCSGLTSVTIPQSVTSIGFEAFEGCSGLTSIEIPNSVTSIGEGTFTWCSGLTSVTIPNSVTSIEKNAFSYCSGLTSVTIGNSVTSIGNEAFTWCSGLTSMVVDSGNSVYDSRGGCNAIIKTSNNELVAGCKNTIIPNSVTSIGDYAFSNCNCLTSVTIPNSVTSIGKRAFNNCSGLTSVTIGNSVTSIGSETFFACYGLTSVTIPNSVTSIGEKAFIWCSGLTSVTIPNSVKSIGNYAFQECRGLTSVTIGNSVTSIGQGAFDGWDLPVVISKIENPLGIFGKSDNYYRTFSLNTFNNATLYVPVGTIDKYKATEGWKDFIFIEEGEPTGIPNIEGNGAKELKRYTLDGRTMRDSHKGINIIQMNDGTIKKVVVK